MHRFSVSEKDFFLKNQNRFFKIKGSLYHHIFTVLRHKKGDLIEFITEKKGHHYILKVVEKLKQEALGKVLEKKKFSLVIPDFLSNTSPSIQLCLGLSRFSTMEKVIEKSSELGVKSLQPFISDFSFLKKKNKISETRKKRWRKILLSATQQSARGDLMKIEEVLFIEELWLKLEKRNQREVVAIFAYEGNLEENLKSIFSLPRFLFKASPLGLSQLKEIWLFIGSEGGFSSREVKEFQKRNLNPISLGSGILKVETACLTLISIIKYELGRRKNEN